MDLEHVQSVLEELYKSKNEIDHIVPKILNIALFRSDIEEIIFLKINRLGYKKETIGEIYKEVGKLALIKGFTSDEYKQIFDKVKDKVEETRKCNWYDVESSEVIPDFILKSSVSEITNRIDQINYLLESSFTTPERLIRSENEKELKNSYILHNQLSWSKTIINKIREYLIDYLCNIEAEKVAVFLEEGIDTLKEDEDMELKKGLESLIEEGYLAKEKCLVERAGGIKYIKGVEYVSWIEKTKLFLRTNIKDEELYRNFTTTAKNANGQGSRFFEEMIGTLTALISIDSSELEKKANDNKVKKIFISHAEKDKQYIDKLVSLLNNIGIKKSAEHIFCSSLSGYGIPYGENIFEYLKSELDKKDIMVLFVLSDNYYESAPCLNEMGAAWISSKEYNTILTPNFDFKKIKGAVDPSKISFYMNDEDGLNKFRDKIIEIFELENVSYQIWEGDRRDFLKSINNIAEVEKVSMNTRIEIERVKATSENEIELQLRFINVTERELEFKYIDINLTDSSGKSISLTAKDTDLDNFRLYGKENRVVHWTFAADSKSEYIPRRDVRDLSTLSFEIY